MTDAEIRVRIRAAAVAFADVVADVITASRQPPQRKPRRATVAPCHESPDHLDRADAELRRLGLQ